MFSLKNLVRKRVNIGVGKKHFLSQLTHLSISAGYMPWWTGSALVMVMGLSPLSESTLIFCQLDLRNKFHRKLSKFIWLGDMWKNHRILAYAGSIRQFKTLFRAELEHYSINSALQDIKDMENPYLERTLSCTKNSVWKIIFNHYMPFETHQNQSSFSESVPKD